MPCDGLSVYCMAFDDPLPIAIMAAAATKAAVIFGVLIGVVGVGWWLQKKVNK